LGPQAAGYLLAVEKSRCSAPARSAPSLSPGCRSSNLLKRPLCWR